jgi:hypothetical protein
MGQLFGVFLALYIVGAGMFYKGYRKTSYLQDEKTRLKMSAMWLPTLVLHEQGRKNVIKALTPGDDKE